MRVLLVTTDIDRPEANLFKGLNEGTIEVQAMCDPDSPLFDELGSTGIRLHGYRIRKRIDLKLIRWIRKLVVTERIDIVHVLRKRALSNVNLAVRALPVKVVTYRGVIGHLSFLDPGSWLTFLNPHVDKIICVSKPVQDYLNSLRLGPWQLSTSKLVTIHKGHSPAWYAHLRAPALQEFGIPEGAYVVGCVAAMRKRKGIHVLLEALDLLPDDLPVHLLLVGEIRDRFINKMYHRHRRKLQIHFTGFRADAPALAGAMDLFVLPVVRPEGLPRSLIEAMAQGVPAVISDTGGGSFVVEDGVSGRIVPPGDAKALAEAIDLMLSDPKRLREIGQRASERIGRHFNITTTIARTRDVYYELLPNGNY